MLQPSLAKISATLFADETLVVRSLVEIARLPLKRSNEISARARKLVTAVRSGRVEQGGIEEFMQEYSLSSEEGVVLMCLAEALLRIPDAETADKLIADKIGGKSWDKHVGQSDSLFVNASSWGLMLTGQVISLKDEPENDIGGYLKRLVSRSGEPIIRQAMRHAMRIMGKQFVLGRTIKEALKVATPARDNGYRFSFDMLGEAAMTMADAERYFASYSDALKTVANSPRDKQAVVWEQPSISVKLSALHPRYDERNRERALDELYERALKLAVLAKTNNLGLTIDAEEVDRLELSLSLFAKLANAPELSGWNGLGLAVQAYSKRAYPVLQWLIELAQLTGRRFPVRLVKGAYWDTEIKRAQEAGFSEYPLFTRKVSTDVSYLACARLMLKNQTALYCQFATHNAQTVAAISVMAEGENEGEKGADYEFQRLHGMGHALYDEVVGSDKLDVKCRIYAPVGSHEDLLAYLVRRLLENGANSSFVNRLADDELPIAEIIVDPVSVIETLSTIHHPNIPLPSQIFAPRMNSAGPATWDQSVRQNLTSAIKETLKTKIEAASVIGGDICPVTPVKPIIAPHDHSVILGHVSQATPEQVETALHKAEKTQHDWDLIGGEDRARILEKAADLYEQNQPHLLGLLIREAGKTLDNAVADLREAVDFLRYYAAQARIDFNGPRVMPGPTGELNELSLHGRGIFACIAPWNFPLAIFTGQVAAGLAAGNAVLAKPAEQTPLIAYVAVKLLHQAGIPGDILALLPGDGAAIGKVMLAHKALSGVAFTGSNDTAAIINATLAKRSGAIVPLIAETGGMNTMIVDSSALPEQATRDLIDSAFDSAGQRCSAARILFVQDDIATHLLTMLQGATEEMVIGDPLDYHTDIGPVIDSVARDVLQTHKQNMAKTAKTLIDRPLPSACKNGTFVSPAIYELDDLQHLKREVFGPVLHVVRFKADRLHKVCEAINNTGYGLTLGLHTRIERTIAEVRGRVKVGNMYVNRNQIGAIVGAQPFGGEAMSGTGPKAGGPHYLHRYAVERVMSQDTTASGGNAALMSLRPHDIS